MIQRITTSHIKLWLTFIALVAGFAMGIAFISNAFLTRMPQTGIFWHLLMMVGTIFLFTLGWYKLADFITGKTSIFREDLAK